MAIFTESPYITALKEPFLTSRCSACFSIASNKCPECEVMVYCNDQCRAKDILFHKIECQAYKNCSERHRFSEAVLARMITRAITRLSLDGGEPETDLCSNVTNSIPRRSWADLLGHRDEIPRSERHCKDWFKTKHQFKILFGNQFDNVDLLEIFGKILINRFRVGIHENLLDGRVAVGWAIYLTASRFNHSCQPDLLQCSYDINMRLKLTDTNRKIPQTALEFDQLTVSYRHQNDFRLTNAMTYVPTRRQRREFVSFFFFNCHCTYCVHDLRNRYAESATNRICDRCGDSLILQETYDDPKISMLTCLGRKKCLNTERIVDRVTISVMDNTEQTIDMYEEKLHEIEQLLHPESVLLLQQYEKVFFAYQKLISQGDLNENQHSTFVYRAIQLGERLLQLYDIHLKQSSIYPKIFVTDVAALYEISGEKDRAKQLYQKAINLWRFDYDNHINYQDLNVKL
ncbi:unnamed protein product [Adineta steineri]|uniref:MYND-type domain-containing protein n=1 Tax=Adineta steineri TaxID=433720 RepID=A0A818HGB6_9BILA|nr:unnamed protein product [Adineta steineri]CAF3508175.1 unnamed protein product [Adineta steineri]